MTEIESVAVMLVRVLGVGMMTVALIGSTANMIANWHSIHPAFIGYFIWKQTLRTTLLFLAGGGLVLWAAPLGQWLASGLS